MNDERRNEIEEGWLGRLIRKINNIGKLREMLNIGTMEGRRIEEFGIMHGIFDIEGKTRTVDRFNLYADYKISDRTVTVDCGCYSKTVPVEEYLDDLEWFCYCQLVDPLMELHGIFKDQEYKDGQVEWKMYKKNLSEFMAETTQYQRKYHYSFGPDVMC